MIGVWCELARRCSALIAGVIAVFMVGTALAQVPIPMQEQVRLFNSLPPSQQQSLIRELQRQLPPAQRDAVLGMLQGRGGATAEDLDPDAAAAFSAALEGQSEADGAQGVEREPRLSPRDTLVIEFTRNLDDATQRSAEQQAQLSEFQDRLAKGNPYQLDAAGTLYLPGVPTMAMAGLNVDEATVRVQAETALRPFTVVLTFLPLEPVGTDALKPFGYDLFERPPSTFAPSGDIPVPVDYVLGPGDTVNVQLFGSENAEYFLIVGREGAINFPEIGPLNVSGLTFSELRDTVNERVTAQMIGVRASVTLGELRSIEVFVLGDVVRPGSYTVSGLSRITHALFASGGVEPIGSLRRVALLRGGATVATLDLYDLLLSGNTSGDARLEPGDSIFVPPVGPTVAVDGEVRRPAIYELNGERSVSELVALAGGFNANANRRTITLERIVPNRGRTAEDIDLSAAAAGGEAIRDGDTIRVLPNLEQLQNAVRLTGNVYQQGVRQWRPGMRLSDLLPSPELVRPKSDLSYVMIRRELAPNVNVEVLSADLAAIWARAPGANDVALQPRDTVYVFSLDDGRQHVIEPIIEELKAQAASNRPLPLVRVAGQVRAAGEYPLEPNMRVSDLLRAGGGLSEAAYSVDAELTRYAIVGGEYRETELVDIDLAAVLRGDANADLAISPYDALSIKEVPNWRAEGSVTLRGQVKFPGTYSIRLDETLSSVLVRAGGLTPRAFPEGSVFTRVELRQREREQLETLARRVETDLASISLSDPNSSDAVSVGQSLITQLRNAVPTGRLVIRLDGIVAGNAANEVLLRDGDELFVLPFRQEVMVLGEVQYATSHLFEGSLGRDDYIAKSGGLTERADEDRIYVVRANGEVVAEAGRRWFSRDTNLMVRPGDAVVVPYDVDRTRPLARWSAVSQILYNSAIAAAAVNSF